jgi:uncharacterized caspase-like protein
MSNKYALIIGIENYNSNSGLRNVKFALNDAQEMVAYAKQAGFQLIGDKPLLDNEASYRKVISDLKHMFYHAKPEDFIMIYYAGHGHYAEDGGYIIPYNYLKGHDFDESCCISFDSIDKRFKKKKIQRFIFFLDTCFSGAAGEQIDIRATESNHITIPNQVQEKIDFQMEDMLYKEMTSKNVGRVIFTSSLSTESSRAIKEFKHGLFTYYLLSALAMKDEKNMINVEQLITTVKENIKTYSFKHCLKQIPKAHTYIDGEFLIPAYERKGNNTFFPSPTANSPIKMNSERGKNGMNKIYISPTCFKHAMKMQERFHNNDEQNSEEISLHNSGMPATTE